jgi:hypothetical protein
VCPEEGRRVRTPVWGLAQGKKKKLKGECKIQKKPQGLPQGELWPIEGVLDVKEAQQTSGVAGICSEVLQLRGGKVNKKE